MPRTRRLVVVLLAGMGAAGACSEGTPATPQAPATVAQRIDSLAQAHLTRGPASSVGVAVVKGADTLVMRGYGLAERATGRAAGPATVYEIGSVTKQFTAAAILRLAEQGKLGLDDDLSKYVPFPLQGRRVSIRQLLNHTSGIPSVTADAGFWAAAAQDLTPEQIVAFVAGDPFNFEPGTDFRYNNTGYVLLGMIVEKASGRPYASFLEEEFFRPLGLRQTRYCPNEGVRDTSYATGYSAPPPTRQFQHASYISMSGPYSAGALCSNVREYVLWQRALHGGRILAPPSYQLMTTPGSLSDGRPLDYGFGFFLGTLGSHRMIQHSGGINGFATMQAYFPDASLSVVVFTNTDSASPEPLAYNIARVVLGLPLQ